MCVCYMSDDGLVHAAVVQIESEALQVYTQRLCRMCESVHLCVCGVQVSRQELDKVRSCKSNLNKMLARVLELKQVHCTC